MCLMQLDYNINTVLSLVHVGYMRQLHGKIFPQIFAVSSWADKIVY